MPASPYHLLIIQPDPDRIALTQQEELEVWFESVVFDEQYRYFCCQLPYYGSMADALTLCEKRYPTIVEVLSSPSSPGSSQ